jgi:hypothetical protein
MFSLLRITLIAVCLLAAVTLHALCAGNSIAAEWELLASLLVLCPLATSFSGGPSVRDATFKATLALPNAASTTVTQATGFDTEASTRSDFTALHELLLTAPALNTTILPDTKTMTYNLIASASANMGTPTTVQASVLVQTGAGGVGAAAATDRIKLPSNIGAIGRYVGLTAVSGANTTDASSKSATLELMF